MKKKDLVIGGIAAATLLVGGWALAQSAGHGPGGMHGMGPGMHGQMGPGMRGQMGPGMMGMGPGMMGGVRDHGRAQRHPRPVPQPRSHQTHGDEPPRRHSHGHGIGRSRRLRRRSRSTSPKWESGSKKDVTRVCRSRPRRCTRSSETRTRSRARMRSTEKGIVVVQTSTDATAVKALQDHAAEVTDLAQRGMVAAHEAMMRNGGMMRGAGGLTDHQH